MTRLYNGQTEAWVGIGHTGTYSASFLTTTACDPFVADEQEIIAYRIAKCCSRYGDNAGAIAGIEQLLYTCNFWSEKYRFGASFIATWSLQMRPCDSTRTGIHLIQVEPGVSVPTSLNHLR